MYYTNSQKQGLICYLYISLPDVFDCVSLYDGVVKGRKSQTFGPFGLFDLKTLQGTGYVDDGIVCHDAEDGLITNIRPDNEEKPGSICK